MDLNVPTVTGKTLGENIQGAKILNDKAIRSIDNPYSAEIQKTPEDLRNALLDTYANFLEDKITGNDRDLTVTETGEIQQRCRELWEKCRET